jgi:CRISPR-associated protein Csm3
MRMIGRVQLEARLSVLTGLHIGAGKDTLEIGGIDNPVIKHPHTQEPFVPGSSLKGKMRYLLEWAFGTIRQDGHPWGFNENDPQQRFDLLDPVQRIFGTPAKREKWDGGPTRLICRDAMLSQKWRDDALKSGRNLTEDKTEVVIDRIAGKAHEVGPRQTERVPAGALFEAEFVFRLYDTADGGARDRQCLAWLIQALDLLEQDALGGSGSRGYGRIKFVNLTLIGLDGRKHPLDNVFRGHVFRREAPPEELLAVINEATTEPAQAAA